MQTQSQPRSASAKWIIGLVFLAVYWLLYFLLKSRGLAIAQHDELEGWYFVIPESTFWFWVNGVLYVLFAPLWGFEMFFGITPPTMNALMQKIS